VKVSKFSDHILFIVFLSVFMIFINVDNNGVSNKI